MVILHKAQNEHYEVIIKLTIIDNSSQPTSVLFIVNYVI